MVSTFSKSSADVGFHLMAPMAMDVVARETVSSLLMMLWTISLASWILLKDEKRGDRLTAKSDGGGTGLCFGVLLNILAQGVDC